MTDQRIPPEILEIHEGLDRECTFLHTKWKMYTELFTEGQENVNAMNMTAGAFFGYLRCSLPEEVGLGIARLADSAQCGHSRQDLSLRRLLNVIDVGKHTGLVREIEAWLRRVDGAVSPLRRWRSKGIAHLNLPTVIDRENNPLPNVTLSDIEMCLACIAGAINAVSRFFEGRANAYKAIAFANGGTYWLLYYLRLGVEKHEQNLRSASGTTPSLFRRENNDDDRQRSNP